MLGLLLFASTTVSVVPQEIRADPASLAAATDGLVRDAAPRLGYDPDAAMAWRDGARPPFRLAYATSDELFQATETRDLLIAHALAAELIRNEDEPANAPDYDGTS